MAKQWVMGAFAFNGHSNDVEFIISAEAAIALRQRLNETVEELDNVRKERNELGVKLETQVKELVIAKSDCEFILNHLLSCY